MHVIMHLPDGHTNLSEPKDIYIYIKIFMCDLCDVAPYLHYDAFHSLLTASDVDTQLRGGTSY
jgi:hypothetical protein